MSLPIYHTAETALQKLIGYVAQELSITVIQASQEHAQAGRPAQPYASVMRTAQRDLSSTFHERVGDELATPEGDDDDQTHELILTRTREITVEVKFFGDTGPSLAEQLTTTVGRISARDYLHAAGISIRPLGDIVDTREMRDTTHEASAMIEIGVIYDMTDESSVGTIETVTSNISGESHDYDATYTP